MGKQEKPLEYMNSHFSNSDSQFRNRLLIAMPSLLEGDFNKSVIYMCAHSEAGAMGIVINQPLPNVAFGELLEQLSLTPSRTVMEPLIHFGGPVDTGRGFVLHSNDFVREDTVHIEDGMCITGTIDILKAMAEGTGPHKSIFALGYAGWGPGQLETEIQLNNWLTVPADDDIIFSPDLPGKWEKALSSLGIRPHALSLHAGRA
jgi:putative transcriptional regulator